MQPPGLFGREVEFTRLGEALAAGQPIAIVGEAGVGKTTLVRAAVAAAGLEVREGGALETLAWMPFLALRRAVGDDLRGDATAVAIEVERRLGPQLLFIDDLQWTDDATRQVLALLTGRISLVVTIRASDAAAPEVIAMAAAANADVLELTGVDSTAALEIVHRARPGLEGSALDLVVAEGAGNPLLLEELATRGHPTSSLARALTLRLDRLSDAGRSSFALLAVAGHGLPADALGPGASELVASGVAIREGGALAPRHALLADAMVASLTYEVLRQTHDQLTSIVLDPGERAHHLAGAGRRAEALAAAQDAANRSVTLSERAALLELVARVSEGPDVLRARIVACRLLVANGGTGSARAIELLEPIGEGSPDLLLERAALLGNAYWDTGDLVASREAYARGLAVEIGVPSAAAARLAAGAAAFVGNVDGDLEEARRILGRAIDSGLVTPRVVGMNETVRMFADGVDTFDSVEEAYRGLVADKDEPGAAFGTARNVAYIAMVCRGYVEAHRFLLRAMADFESLEMAGRADDLRSEDVQMLLFGGQLDEGLRLADALLEHPLPRRARDWTMTKRAQLLAAQGRTDAAGAILDEMASTVSADYPGRGELLAARIETASWAGRPDDVLQAYAEHVAMPTPSAATHVMPLLDAQWARLESGLDPGPAMAQQPWAMLAAASLESEGIIALHAGEPASAAASFGSASSMWARFHVGRELICRWAHGESLRLAQSPDAQDVLRDALNRAEALGYGPAAARARRSLRQAGVRVAPPRRETATDRLAQMTGREREGLQLVGRGLTTPQIARRMGLGRGTVDQVLGAATRKLGAASRIQAATILAGSAAAGRAARRAITVRNEADVGEVVLAALGGASVSVDSETDPALIDRIQGDLRRLGRDDAITVEPISPAADLAVDGVDLLGRLVEGMSLGEAAASLHLSRRTADRRLAAARNALGVTTTAEALVKFQRRVRIGDGPR